MDDSKVTITSDEYKHLISMYQRYDWMKSAIYKAAHVKDGRFEYISSAKLETYLELTEPVLMEMLREKARDEARKEAEDAEQSDRD